MPRTEIRDTLYKRMARCLLFATRMHVVVENFFSMSLFPARNVVLTFSLYSFFQVHAQQATGRRTNEPCDHPTHAFVWQEALWPLVSCQSQPHFLLFLLLREIAILMPKLSPAPQLACLHRTNSLYALTRLPHSSTFVRFLPFFSRFKRLDQN